MCVARCSNGLDEAEAGYLLTADRLKVRKHLLDSVGTGRNIHT